MVQVPVNKTNLAQRKDYGVMVARPGYNASYCADNQLLFNSSWPILQLAGVYEEELISQSGTTPSSGTLISTTTEDYSSYCAADKEYIYTKIVTKRYLVVTDYIDVVETYGARHNLGFRPLAFQSNTLSGVPGYVVVTNIDISTDVDYPYTEAPTGYYGGIGDYGIKSRAYFKHSMPRVGEEWGFGINSRLNSKLVQAVKTLDTAVEDNGTKNIRWRPPTDADGKEIFGIRDFEYFGFIKYNNSDIYTPRRAIFYPLLSPGSENTVIIDPGQSTSGYSPASLVVLRSPMVSPEVVEVTYGN